MLHVCARAWLGVQRPVHACGCSRAPEPLTTVSAEMSLESGCLPSGP